MNKRDELFWQLWDAQDEAYDLMCEYDSLPHHYGNNVMYQAEGHIVDLIAVHPGITVTDLGKYTQKTPSACSQMVRKLRKKGWVVQTRNAENNRQYNLRLTEEGMEVYHDHQAFVRKCQELTYQLLSEFSEEELENHIKVQRMINEAYRGDIKRSRDRNEEEDSL